MRVSAIVLAALLVLALSASVESANITLEDSVRAVSDNYVGFAASRSGALFRASSGCHAELLAGAGGEHRAIGSVQTHERRTQELWHELTELLSASSPALQPGADFGASVAVARMSTGAELLAVGAPNAAGGGVVEVFRRGADGSWTHLTTLRMQAALFAAGFRGFGFDVAMHGEWVVVGYPGSATSLSGCEAFRLSSDSSSLPSFHVELTTDLGDQLGYSVSVRGSMMACGRPTHGPAGSALLKQLLLSSSADAVGVSVGSGMGQTSAGARCGHAVLVTDSPQRVLLGCPEADEVLVVNPLVDPNAIAELEDVNLPTNVVGPAMFGATLAWVGNIDGSASVLIGAPQHDNGVGVVQLAQFRTNDNGVQAFTVVSTVASPSSAQSEFGSDIVASGEYFGVGAPAEPASQARLARRTCPEYKLDFAGTSNGDVVATRMVVSGAGSVEVQVSTGDAAHPPVAFDSVRPHLLSLDLGTPNVAFEDQGKRGWGIGLGGAFGTHKNKKQLGNVLIIGKEASTSEPTTYRSGGTITLEFAVPVTVHSLVVIDSDGDFDDLRFYDEAGVFVGKNPVPFGGGNSVVEVTPERSGVGKMEIPLTGGGALASLTFSTCSSASSSSGGSSGSSGSSSSGGSTSGSSPNPNPNPNAGLGAYHMYRVGAADPACENPLPPSTSGGSTGGGSSPAATLSSLLSFVL